MVKPEKFEHLHLIYHFKIPLNYVASLTKRLSLKAWLRTLTWKHFAPTKLCR